MRKILISSIIVFALNANIEQQADLLVESPLESQYLGSFIVTSYRSVKNQTDSTPFITSIGERVCSDGVAVSQDWLRSKKLKYGDWIYIQDVGLKRINDTMNKRWRNRFDCWLPFYSMEHQFYLKFGKRKLKIWLIKTVKSE